MAKWSQAYSVYRDEEIPITKALKDRNGNDPRAGHLWCCESCYLSNKGFQLLTKRESIDGRVAHFSKWPDRYEEGNFYGCRKAQLSHTRRETFDYAHYYILMEKFLQESAKNHAHGILSFSSNQEGDQSYDFKINFLEDHPLDSTKILIIDENKRRAKILKKQTRHDATIDFSMEKPAIDFYPLRNPNLVLIISEYTQAQLDDFNRTGIELFLDRLSTLVKLVKSAEFEERDRLVKLEAQNEINKIREKELLEAWNLPENVKAREVEEQKKIDKQNADHLTYFSRRLAGIWKARGFDSYREQKRYYSDNVAVYFNKYYPEKELDAVSMPNSIQHYQKNRICEKESEDCSDGDLCWTCEKISRGKLNDKTSFNYKETMRCAPSMDDISSLPRVVFEIDSENPLQLNTHCSLCDEKLDSFKLNFSKIDSSVLNDYPKAYPPWGMRFELFTTIERALLDSIGVPQPISGIFNGIERAEHFNWRFSKIKDRKEK